MDSIFLNCGVFLQKLKKKIKCSGIAIYKREIHCVVAFFQASSNLLQIFTTIIFLPKIFGFY